MAATVAMGGNNGWPGLQDRESAGTALGAQTALNTERVTRQLKGLPVQSALATDGSTAIRGLYFHRTATGTTVRLAANSASLLHNGTVCDNADGGADYAL